MVPHRKHDFACAYFPFAFQFGITRIDKEIPASALLHLASPLASQKLTFSAKQICQYRVDISGNQSHWRPSLELDRNANRLLNEYIR